MYLPEDYELHDQMSGYWLHFLRTSDPHGNGLPQWPTVAEASEDVMEFGSDGSVMSPRPRAEAIDFWLHFDGPIR